MGQACSTGVLITVRAVGTNRALPTCEDQGGVGQIRSHEIGSSEVGMSQVGTNHFRIGQVGISQVCTLKIPGIEVSALKNRTGQITSTPISSEPWRGTNNAPDRNGRAP